MPDRQGAIRVPQHPDLRLHVVTAVTVCRDLQQLPVEVHAVVLADHPLMMLTQDVLEHLRVLAGHKGRAGLPRRFCKLRVVRRQVHGSQVLIGPGHVGNAGRRQFLDQAVLVGPEGSLGAPPGLRRVGRDHLHAQLLHGPAKLCQMHLVHLATCLWGIPVMTGPVRIQRTQQPLPLDHLAHPLKTAPGAFLLAQEHRVVFARGSLHRHDQVPVLPGHPFMGTAVLVHQHPRPRRPSPALAVRPAPRRPGHHTGPLQRVPHPGIAALAAGPDGTNCESA